MTENEIIAQALIFILAGYETTTTALEWCFYELAVNADIQQKLYQELDKVFKSSSDIEYDKFIEVPYLDSVIDETLRLHNPFKCMKRVCTKTCTLNNYEFEKGSYVEYSIHAVHHNPDFWPNPYNFNPDRFMPQNRQDIKPHTFIPFGAGPRICIARRFALIQLKIVVTSILINFTLSIGDKTRYPLKMSKNPLFHKTQDLFIRFEKR